MSETEIMVTKEAEAVRLLMDVFKGDDDETREIVIESETNFKEAVVAILASIDDDKALVAGIKDRLDDLGSRKSRVEKRSERKRAALEAAFMVAECGPIETPCGTVSLKKGTQQLRIVDESQIPAEFWVRGDPTLDRRALLAALKEEGAESIPGATLSNAPMVLQIRVK